MEELIFIIVICAVLTFVISLSLLIYHSDDRKQLQKDLEKKEKEYKLVLDRYLNCMINKANLETKVELLERYIDLESSDDDE